MLPHQYRRGCGYQHIDVHRAKGTLGNGADLQQIQYQRQVCSCPGASVRSRRLVGREEFRRSTSLRLFRPPRRSCVQPAAVLGCSRVARFLSSVIPPARWRVHVNTGPSRNVWLSGDLEVVPHRRPSHRRHPPQAQDLQPNQRGGDDIEMMLYHDDAVTVVYKLMKNLEKNFDIRHV